MTPKTGFNKESWKSLLPEVYSWIEKVDLVKSKDLVPAAHHVIAVSAGEEDKDAFEIDAPALADPFKRKLIDAAKALGWRGASGSLSLVVDSTPVLLLVPTKVKTSGKQRGRQFGQDAAKVVKDLKIDHLALVRSKDLSAVDMLEGLAAGLYAAVGFKGAKKDSAKPAPSKLPTKITLVGSEVKDEVIGQTRQLIRALAFTRMLQDAPANWLDPVRFGEIAKEVATESRLKVKIQNKDEITAMGMGLFVSVSNGSEIEPRLITIEIDGEDNSKTVALVGKGLTFDAGGISIKPSAGMEEMKYDMSGGAAVLGAALYLSKVKPPCKVVCVVGATENMPSGAATKPGDIIVAMNGKTVEVQNTDAEGRLVLADLLHYVASSYNPDLIIDVATLTGAVLMALGTAGAGLMSNDQASADYVLGVSQAVGEPMWQLPLWPELEKEAKGDVADLNNIAKSSVKAGSIMGAIFLREFVGDRKWVHLDIAGTGWNTKATGFPASGGSAYALRTMAEACLRFNQ